MAVQSSPLTPMRPEGRVTYSHTSKRRSTTMVQSVHLEFFSAPTGRWSLPLGMRTPPGPDATRDRLVHELRLVPSDRMPRVFPHTCAIPSGRQDEAPQAEVARGRVRVYRSLVLGRRARRAPSANRSEFRHSG